MQLSCLYSTETLLSVTETLPSFIETPLSFTETNEKQLRLYWDSPETFLA